MNHVYACINQNPCGSTKEYIIRIPYLNYVSGGVVHVWPDGFDEKMDGNSDIFAFRQRRSRETAFSKDYDELYDLLRYEKQHGHIVWVMGPACAFDASSRKVFEKLVNNGYVHALLAGNALATHDLEGTWLHTALGQNIYKQ